MAKEWEEDEEVEETEEEEEFDLIAETKRNIRYLIEERRKYDPLTEKYMVLSQRIADETENLRNLEGADNEHAQKETAERNRYTGIFNIIGNVVGSFGGSLATALINRKNVKTVVGKEEEGDLPMRSGATKFLR